MKSQEDIKRRINQIRRLMDLHIEKQGERFDVAQSDTMSGYTPTREELERYWEDSDPISYQAYKDGYNQGLMEGMLEVLEWVLQ